MNRLPWLLAFSCTLAFAPNDFGNGGGVLECETGEKGVTSVRLLDYLEAEILGSTLQPNLGPSEAFSGNPEQKLAAAIPLAEVALERLHRLDPDRARRYRARLVELPGAVRFLADHQFGGTDDFGLIPPLPAACKGPFNLVWTAPARFPDPARLFVHSSRWAALSLLDAAGALLHEIIYEETRQLGHGTSEGARYFNRLVSSTRMERVEEEEYRRIAEEIFRSKWGTAGTSPRLTFGVARVRLEVGRPFRVDLFDYLEYVPEGVALYWTSIPGLPSGMKVTPANGARFLEGVAPREAAVSQAIVTVMERGKARGTLTLDLEFVRGPVSQGEPAFRVASPVNLGSVEAGSRATLGLGRQIVQNPRGLPLRFRVVAIRSPLWARITDEGLLVLTPPADAAALPFQLVVVVSSPGQPDKAITVFGRVHQPL